MKKVSKVLALFMAVTMLTGISVGCSSEKSASTAAPSTSTPSTAESTAAAPSSTEKVKITYALWANDTEAANTQKVLDKFNASQDHIEVSLLPIPHDTYMEKLNTMATADQLPDTAIMNEQGVITWAIQGKLADVSTMYSGGSKPLDQLAFKYNDKVVAYSCANNIIALFYNKKMFDAAGVDYPPTTADKAWTWDQFVATAKKLTLDKNGKTPNDSGFDAGSIKQYGCMVENLTWQLETWCLSNGGGFFSKDGQNVTVGESASTDAIQKVADLYLKDHVAPLSTGLTDDGVSRSLVAGTCAMTTNGTWNIGTTLSEAKTKNGLDYGIAVLPYMKDKVTINTAGPNVVFNTTKHPKEAMEFLKWYCSEDNNWDGLINTGIWGPISGNYYTDETMTKKWLNNPNFPPYEQSKAVLVDYSKDYSHQACWYYTKNVDQFDPLLASTLGDVWTGKATAQKAITDKLPALKAAFQGN